MTAAAARAFGEEITVEMLDADPYPIYARMREAFPVCWVPAVGLWFVTRWADGQYVNTHPEIFTADVTDSPLVRALGPNALTVDGDLHKRFREPIEAPLKPRLVDEWAPGIVTPIAEELLEAIAAEGSAEIMAAFLEPVSVRSLAEVMGIGAIASDTLRGWFGDLATGGANFEEDPGKFAIADAAARGVNERLAPLLDRLETEPDGSVLSRMLHAPDGMRPRQEVLSNLKLILLGGMQEPGHAAGNTLYAILSHADARDRVHADPGLVGAALEEGMRWLSPVGTTTREVLEPVTLAGVQLEPGARVATVSSANRDSTRWERADEFDIDRPPTMHRAFGTGPHFCVGHWLARYEQRIPLQLLFERLPNLRLDPDRRVEITGWEFRGPRALPVIWDA
ncbi:MAG: cytochrome P450 [Gaiellaceae bacterium]